MKIKTRPVEGEAHQWYKNGDHPKDDPTRGGTTLGGIQLEGLFVRYYRNPRIEGETLCKECGNMMLHHGWIDWLGNGITVCPGDWVVSIGSDPPVHTTCKPHEFQASYEEIIEKPPEQDEPIEPQTASEVDMEIAKAIARSLDGMEYSSDVPDEIQNLARKQNLLIAMGASDDILEVYGVSRDEFSAPDTHYFYPKTNEWVGEISELPESERQRVKDEGWSIEAEWVPDVTPEGEQPAMSWQIKAHNKPSVTFTIMEEGEIFCEAIVIQL